MAIKTKKVKDAGKCQAIPKEVFRMYQKNFMNFNAAIFPILDEKQRRLLAAMEIEYLGMSVSAAAETSGLTRKTIYKGLAEIRANDIERIRIRRMGGGRKSKVEQDPDIAVQLEALVEPATCGDPMSPLKWTCLSLRNLSEALGKKGYDVSRNIVGEILHSLGYSLQANAKRYEAGSDHPDRNAQFEYINSRVKSFLRAKNPVISVDTKKKELVGAYKNGGKELRPKGQPTEVKMHDFIDPSIPKAAPYGVYDVGKNMGYVNVGISSDTAAFAVESIRRWWNQMGRAMYDRAKHIMICADAGGSNGYRTRLWKTELQKLANEIGMSITVCHFPPGTSKWNKIEHRLFSHITMNWRGKPLISYEVIIKLIGSTITRTGLKVKAFLDDNTYEKGIKVADKEMRSIHLKRHEFHGEWNYTILSNNNA